MSDFEADLKKVTKAVEKQIADTEKKVGDVTLQAQDEFIKTVQQMSQTGHVACDRGDGAWRQTYAKAGRGTFVS